jgi:hypothetical protein
MPVIPLCGRLEHIGELFIAGLNRALYFDDPWELREHLQFFDLDLRGFAVEGRARPWAMVFAAVAFVK